MTNVESVISPYFESPWTDDISVVTLEIIESTFTSLIDRKL